MGRAYSARARGADLAKGAKAVADTNANHTADGDESRHEGRAHSGEPTHSHEHSTARPVREYRMSRADRVGNAIFSILARTGIGPAHLLTTRGRKTGQLRTIPVVLVEQDKQRWLVAPYGAVSWVLNARAAGQVALRRGRDSGHYTIRELPPADAGPVLKRYVRIASATRPYFRARKDSPVDEFIAEAHRHPVFELTPIPKDQV
jgi:deazaflavin-dependent oxidoreductase (nitroreductase family)